MPWQIKSESEFYDAVRKGLGRAVLHLQSRDPTPYVGIIEEACLRSLGDHFLGESRTPQYLIDLINHSGCKGRIQERLIQALPESNGSREAWHRLEIVACFAKEGDLAAKESVYQSCLNPPTDEYPAFGTEEIIEIDGKDGLGWLIENVSPRVDKGDAYMVKDWLDPFFEDEPVQAVLFLQGIGSDNAKRCIELYESSLVTKPYNPDRKPRTFADLIRLLDNPKENRSKILAWARVATKADVRKAANLLESDLHPQWRTGLLQVFRRLLYPLDPEWLIYHWGKADEETEVLFLTALSNIEHPKVRSVALDLLTSPVPRVDAFGLMRNNYQTGDVQLLLRLANQLDDEDDAHEVALCTHHILDKRKPEDLGPLLEWIYHHNPCSLCREGAVRRLIAENSASREVLEECLFDCVEDSREMARTALFG